jgi:broad specificity phosphatase PhoE
MKMYRTILGCIVLLASARAAIAAEPQLVFLVRHAEKSTATSVAMPGSPPTAASMTSAADDPVLSAEGHERAARLAAVLRSASIRNVFSTEFLRTRQTAAPTAQAGHLEVVTVPARETDALLAQVRQAKGNVLIVGHSNSVPELLKRLGIKDDVSIPDAEYDNLFVVVRPDAGDPILIRLRY